GTTPAISRRETNASRSGGRSASDRASDGYAGQRPARLLPRDVRPAAAGSAGAHGAARGAPPLLPPARRGGRARLPRVLHPVRRLHRRLSGARDRQGAGRRRARRRNADDRSWHPGVRRRLRHVTVLVETEPDFVRTRNAKRGTRNSRVGVVASDLALLFRVPTSAFRVSGLP